MFSISQHEKKQNFPDLAIKANFNKVLHCYITSKYRY